MCHTGYTTRYIKIHQDTCILDSSSNNTSKYNRIQNHDTCILDAGYMRDTCICKGDQDTCGIHPRYMMRCMYLKCIQRREALRALELDRAAIRTTAVPHSSLRACAVLSDARRR